MPVNVTFLLGAGASAQALPTINSLTEDIGKLGRDIANMSPSEFNNYSEVSRFSEDLIWLYNNAQNHLTIDTLAKKFYFKNEIQKLEKLKRTLSLYFNIKQRTGTIDKRYDALLASLLVSDKRLPELPSHIKILTWNYDNQLEFAARAYTDQSMSETMESITSYPRNPYVQPDRLPSIVHLNGISGFYNYDRDTHNPVKSLFISDEKKLTEILNEILYCIEGSEREQLSFFQLLSFAWEGSFYGIKSVEFAQQIASDTDILVIIGYSFPFFNRDFDRKIIAKFIRNPKPNKKIYFQNLTLDGSFLSEQFQIDKNLIHHVKGCDQFFIPHEL